MLLLASPSQHPTTSPRPRAICALCCLAGTAEPQPLKSGRADCPQAPRPWGDLAGSTHGAPTQPGEAGAAAPRRHLETGAWRALTRLPAVSQETQTRASEATPLWRPGGWAVTWSAPFGEARLVSQRLPPTARPPQWGGIAWIPSGLLSHQAARRAGTSIRGVTLCAPLQRGIVSFCHLSLSIKP